MMGQPVEQCARETFGAEGFRPFFERQIGPVPDLCRSFNRILCAKGERLWDRNIHLSLDKRRCR